MRFVVSKEQFLKALNAANHAIVLKNPIPTLANFKLELSEKGLEVTGSNPEITIRSIVPYRNGEDEGILFKYCNCFGSGECRQNMAE